MSQPSRPKSPDDQTIANVLLSLRVQGSNFYLGGLDCEAGGEQIESFYFIIMWLKAMYIRVKRLKTTYFLQCVPSETILQIKEKLQELIDEPVNNQRLILMPDKEILDDSKSLADQKVENDAVVALTLRKGSVTSATFIVLENLISFSPQT
ncbi:ubiquitin family protein [Striga asiatica]|uniref:Ubiquitin family protein n=1 Tax=Striga asiatica TaxID=4170 RepID=A0A5A7PV81_STRAF|nr:ubiquitin family protein [Striga asiatica]